MGSGDPLCALNQIKFFQFSVHLLSAAAHIGGALLQAVAVPVHVLDGPDHALRALPHLSDGVGGVDQVPVTLPDHLPQLFLLLLDLPADFALDQADLLGVVALEQTRRVCDLRHPEGQRRILGHRTGATTTTRAAAGTPTTRKTERKFPSCFHVGKSVTTAESDVFISYRSCQSASVSAQAWCRPPTLLSQSNDPSRRGVT